MAIASSQCIFSELPSVEEAKRIAASESANSGFSVATFPIALLLFIILIVLALFLSEGFCDLQFFKKHNSLTLKTLGVIVILFFFMSMAFFLPPKIAIWGINKQVENVSEQEIHKTIAEEKESLRSLRFNNCDDIEGEKIVVPSDSVKKLKEVQETLS